MRLHDGGNYHRCIGGTLYQFLIKQMAFDPAIATGPFITTANDIFGIFLFFYMAKIFLGFKFIKMKVLHIEENHPSLIEGLDALGIKNDLAFNDSLPEVLNKIGSYDGLILSEVNSQ